MLRVFFSCNCFVDRPAGAASSEVRLSAESPSIAVSVPRSSMSAICCPSNSPSTARSRVARATAGDQRTVRYLVSRSAITFFMNGSDRLIATALIAEMIIQDGQSELLRARTPVGPLETPFCELLDVVMLTERTAIKRHAKPVYFSHSLICFHGSGPTASPNATAP